MMRLACAYDVAHYKFMGKERDGESNLDDFGARYYSSSLGRSMTPDWSDRATAVRYAAFGDPQSLNLYGFVKNDPVSRVDADGHVDDAIRNQGDKCGTCGPSGLALAKRHG
jgi:RHS repeat-associated protein